MVLLAAMPEGPNELAFISPSYLNPFTFVQRKTTAAVVVVAAAPWNVSNKVPFTRNGNGIVVVFIREVMFVPPNPILLTPSFDSRNEM